MVLLQILLSANFYSNLEGKWEILSIDAHWFIINVGGYETIMLLFTVFLQSRP